MKVKLLAIDGVFDDDDDDDDDDHMVFTNPMLYRHSSLQPVQMDVALLLVSIVRYESTPVNSQPFSILSKYVS